MLELLKNKWMAGFIIVMVGFTYLYSTFSVQPHEHKEEQSIVALETR